MRVITANTVHTLLDYTSLISRLREAFAAPVSAPPRQHMSIGSERNPGTLLLMPSWETGSYLALKVISVFPRNPERNLPTVIGTVLLFDGSTGVPLLAADGSAVTVRRTAATSALAADSLARPDAKTLLMVGAGTLAPHLVRAHAKVRQLSRIWIWNRSRRRAAELALILKTEGLPVQTADDLGSYAGQSDIISCATSSQEPLIHGSWLRPGTHLDLVGAFTPEMCEVDSQAVTRSSVFVDTRQGALSEAGDLIQPLRLGLWSQESIRGDLHELVTEQVGRQNNREITMFKSVGVALEDLVAARLLYESLGA